MNWVSLFQSRLLFVTGKGGVGKTCTASAVAALLAGFGKKTLLIEVDNFHSSLTGIFGIQPSHVPSLVRDPDHPSQAQSENSKGSKRKSRLFRKNRGISEEKSFIPDIEPMSFSKSAAAHLPGVREHLSICNLRWREALSDWLKDTIPVRQVVHRIQDNQVAMLFLDATPGARELVTLSKIVKLLEEFDHIVVDLPASGHAYGILRVPHTARNLMTSGPVYSHANKILEVLAAPTTKLLLVSLPEEMVINETLEFRRKILDQVPQFQSTDESKIGVILNKASLTSISESEKQLLNELQASLSDSIKSASDQEQLRELIAAVLWEKELDAASANSIDRLKTETGFDPFCFTRFGLLGGFEGGTDVVVQQMRGSLNRFLLTEGH